MGTLTIPRKVGNNEVVVVAQISGKAYPRILVCPKTVKHDNGFLFIVVVIGEVDDFAKA